MSKVLAKIKKGIHDPGLFLEWLLGRKAFYLVPDKLFLQLRYFAAFGAILNLKNPKTFSEKLQWLKLNYRKKEFVLMVDKYESKHIVSEKIGKEYLIPLLGVWDSFDEIDFENLPEKFVLKPTHTSGNVFLCKDKGLLDLDLLKKEVEMWLKRDFYKEHREWVYKDVPRKIIAEEYIVDESGYELKDYKFFCFNGEPKLMFVATDRQKDIRFDFFDMNFHHISLINGHPNSEKEIKKPSGFKKMKKLASELSTGIPFVRIDFYDVGGKIYFGEYTFYHFSGFVPFEPSGWDEKLGEWLQLPTLE